MKSGKEQKAKQVRLKLEQILSDETADPTLKSLSVGLRKPLY